MSLLQNEDFVLYQLRSSYLSHIKDGVGERLINVNTSVLNNAAFRAAGWTANPNDIKRTYSPPIPSAITSDYFQAPRSAGLTGPSFADDDDDAGMVTGAVGSNDTLGPGSNAKRRRRKEQQRMEDDDSSDLSDESDDEAEGTQRALQQIKFTKMPLRNRAGSSPLRSTTTMDGPHVMITSPSRPPDSSRLRRGSLGAVEAVKERARRDTVTSSEMSSENELDPSVFKRKQINTHRAAKASQLLSQRIQEDEREDVHLDLDPDAESSDSSLSSEFVGSADSNSLIGGNPLNSSPPSGLPVIAPLMTPRNNSPKKSRPAPQLLQALPPPRPISFVQPVSALTQALKAKEKKPVSPFQRFATLSGEGDLNNSLYIKIYVHNPKPAKPLELRLRRNVDDGTKVTVAETIGLALWRYCEDRMQPPIKDTHMNVNRWVLRMFEDDEVEMDFPAIPRTKAILDFASNNTRGMRGRSRDKPWDEFAIVHASERECKENETETPQYSKDAADASEQSSALPSARSGSDASQTKPPVPTAPPPAPPVVGPFQNPVLGPSFAPSAANRKGGPLDAPSAPTSHAIPRTGAPIIIKVNFTDDHFQIRSTKISVTTDTYLAEVFDRVCRDLQVDKALYVLKVSGTNTVAPSDRTVEALGNHTELDLIRRRFIGDVSYGLSGSPGSSSPNAPLFITTSGVPKRGKRNAAAFQPSVQRDVFLTATTSANYKRYNVTRKQPMSFASSSSRILALDEEYMHIMPSENPGGTKALFEAPAKTTTIPFSSVVGSKVSRRHPRMFRVVVFKERETKRYDFEAISHAEAQEIVREIRKGMERFQATDGFV